METAKLNIKQWAEDDRPREKMMQKGASALSNAELLAILIGSGTVEESAVGLMKRVMADCDNRLKALGRMSLEELTGNVEVWDKETGKKKRVRRYKGLGEAKAVAIMAANWGAAVWRKMRWNCLPSVPVWIYTIISCRRCRTCFTRNVMCF